MIKEIPCPFCVVGILKLIKGIFPWCTDHYQCEFCDSTYTKEEIED